MGAKEAGGMGPSWGELKPGQRSLAPRWGGGRREKGTVCSWVGE